jgi:hypothetical protein
MYIAVYKTSILENTKPKLKSLYRIYNADIISKRREREQSRRMKESKVSCAVS